MRLHRVEVTAFGPFAGTEVADFDRLADGGLFLLHGATGAGKTSLLDAVCYALYGRVPGSRQGARLRSDHAADTVAPRVLLEFSVGGRRFELTRSPEWQRPKKRGQGTTKEQARVVLRDLAPGGRVSTGHDEVADWVLDLVGFGAEQFTTLVLLPQGEFASFLRSGAEQRRTMLQKLFGTERFDAVERWLSDHRRALGRDVRVAEEETARLVARAEEAHAAIAAPDEGPALDAGVSPEDATAAVTSLAERAVALRDAAATQHRAASAAHAAARQARQNAAEAAERLERRLELEGKLGQLSAAAAEQRDRRGRLAQARAADVLAPLVASLAGTRTRREAAARALAGSAGTALAAGLTAGDLATGDGLETVGAGLRERLGALGEALAAERELTAADAGHARHVAVTAAATAERDEVVALRARLAATRGELAASHAAASAAAAALPDRERDSARAAAVAQAVLERDGLAGQLTGLADAERAAVDAHQAAQDVALDLRERRLGGMAAELAARLADGDPCPVCGAAEHPAPAHPDAGRVTDEEERAATAAVVAAEAARREHEAATRDCAERHAAAAARAGGTDAAAAAAALAAAHTAAEAARAQADAVTAVAEQLASLAAQEETAAAREQAAADRLAAAAEALAALAERRTALRVRVEAARGDDPDVATGHRRTRTLADAVDALLAAHRADAESAAALEAAHATLGEAAEGAGFADPEAALAAVLDPEERKRLLRAADAHDGALARVRARLADLAVEEEQHADPAPSSGSAEPDLLDLLAEPAPRPAADLPGLADAERAAAAAEEHAAGALALTTRAAESLRGLARMLDHHAKDSAPLRERHAVLDAVSRCAEGTGGDNQLRMRLSAYVLAARLEEVAVVASERLLTMSGGRYTLVHSDGLSRGQTRSGLGLSVVDGWTGVRRDPASLSGGETFYVSLALALGLADVVRAEAGGTEIETLLVDEGFGTLDAETLDEVMDTLDGLRTGGRAVGLVSHVADLRDRIPVRLEVVKGRTGSTLRVPAPV